MSLLDKAIRGLKPADKQRVLRVMKDLNLDVNDPAVILLIISRVWERLFIKLPGELDKVLLRGQQTFSGQLKKALRTYLIWQSVVVLLLCMFGVLAAFEYAESRVAAFKAQLPQQTALVADFDSPEKRYLAKWAISDEGLAAYQLWHLNGGFRLWRACEGKNYQKQSSEQGTVCFALSDDRLWYTGIVIEPID